MNRFFLFVLALVLSSCSGVAVKQLSNSKVNTNGVLVYSLPRNIIKIDVIVEKKDYYPGPYAEYADDFLQISSVKKDPYSEFIISDISISPIVFPDTSQYFLYKARGNGDLKKLNVNKQGILTGINISQTDEENPIIFKNPKITKSESKSHFYDTGNDGTKKEHVDTTYRTIAQDSTFIKVPVIKKVLEAKSFEDKAEEAANHLMRIRKRRFKIITGAYDKMPEQGTVEPILNQLNIEEKEYLSLFIGKENTSSQTYSFYVEPMADSLMVFSYFSKDKGFTLSAGKQSEPLTIQCAASGNTKKIQTLFPLKKSYKGLVYRIPAETIITINKGNELYYQQKLLVPQMGVNALLPNKVLISKFKGITVCPITGNVMQIQ